MSPCHLFGLQAVRGEEADYSGWPVKELSRFLKERGVDPSGMIEKADLVKKVAEVETHLHLSIFETCGCTG